MARGNQREQSRQKNLKKLQASSKGDQREGTPQQRNDDDKAALQAKVAAKKAAKEQAEAAEANKSTPVVRKSKPKKDVGLDDMLNAGLAGNKKKGNKK